MDVHRALICVCIMVAQPGLEPEVRRRQFGGFQRDRRAMADWIASFNPEIGVIPRWIRQPRKFGYPPKMA